MPPCKPASRLVRMVAASAGYWSRLWLALAAWLRAGDVLVNEAVSVDLPDTSPDETVSEHAAELARDRSPFGEFLCAFLSITVQPDHCGVTARGGPMPWWVYLRAGVMFVLVLVGVPFFLMKGVLLVRRQSRAGTAAEDAVERGFTGL